MKRLLFMFLVTSFLLPNYIYAGNNLTITCDNSSCSKSSNLPLFSETNIYPSFSVSQVTSIRNTRNSSCDLNFKLVNTPQNNLLADVINIKTFDSQNNWYDNTLKSLFDSQNHYLGSINSSSTKDIIWTATFDKNAGNNYQNISTIFDIDFNFTCSDSSNSSDSSSSESSNQSSSSSSSSPSPTPTSISVLRRISNLFIPQVEAEVLGEQTTLSENQPQQSVLGVQDVVPVCPPVFKYLFILIILINLLFRKSKILSLVLSAIIFLIDIFLISANCRFPYFWVFDIFSFLVAFLILK